MARTGELNLNCSGASDLYRGGLGELGPRRSRRASSSSVVAARASSASDCPHGRAGEVDYVEPSSRNGGPNGEGEWVGQSDAEDERQAAGADERNDLLGVGSSISVSFWMWSTAVLKRSIFLQSDSILINEYFFIQFNPPKLDLYLGFAILI